MKFSVKEILDFIRGFDKAKETFLNGECFWFAYILSGRFMGRIYYNALDNHFATSIKLENGEYALFDVTGMVKSSEGFVEWVHYDSIDSTHYYRILRDSVLHVPQES